MMMTDTDTRNREYQQVLSELPAEYIYEPLILPGINVRTDTFVRIAGYARYEINICGVVRRIKERTTVPHYCGSKGYVTVTLINDAGYRAPVKVHRLLALTFLRHPHNIAQFEVNHKDGNKSNFELTNLEWCTCSENKIHACTNGLNLGRGSARKVLAMNIKTREIHEFENKRHAGDFFGVTTGTIACPLTNPKGIRPYKGYFLKYENDNTAWPVGDGSDINIYGAKAVLAKNVKSGEVTRFSSMQDLGKILGVSTSSVFNQLLYEKPRVYKGYLIRHDTPDVCWDIESNLVQKHIQRNAKFEITDTVGDNGTTIHYGINSCATYIGVPTSSVYGAIYRGSLLRGYSIRIC